jgi:hypothetical protein
MAALVGPLPVAATRSPTDDRRAQLRWLMPVSRAWSAQASTPRRGRPRAMAASMMGVDRPASRCTTEPLSAPRRAGVRPGSGRDCWPTRPRRICGPAPGDEPSVLAQDGVGGDEQSDAAVAGESADERGGQCWVGPGHRRSRPAATQYGGLVAEYEDLGVFGRVGSCEQSVPAHELADHQICQSQGHGRIMPSTCSSRTCRSRAWTGFQTLTTWTCPAVTSPSRRPTSWLVRCQRLVRDYERLPSSHETMVRWAMIGLMTRRRGGSWGPTDGRSGRRDGTSGR